MKTIFSSILLAALIFAQGVQAQPICVSSASAEMRSGPGAKFPVKRSVSRYTPFNQVATQGNWSQVKDVDGSKFWIASKLTSPNLSCVVIKTRKAKLRREPTSESELVSPVAKYTAFKKVDRDGEWVQLEDNKKARYWVHESNVWYPVNHMKVSFN